MTPGPTEEVASTARTLITSLSSAPVVLALVVFNVMYMAGTFYVQVQAQKRFVESTATWERIVEKAMEFCPGAK